MLAIWRLYFCINLDVYLSQQPVFFRLACTFVLTGPQLLYDGHLPPILDVTQGDPPHTPLPKEYFLDVFLQWNFHGRSKPWTYVKNERWKIFTVWVLMVHKWYEWVKEQWQVLLGVVHQVYKWEATQCKDSVQDVFSERQEPCHLGLLLKELAYWLQDEGWPKLHWCSASFIQVVKYF